MKYFHVVLFAFQQFTAWNLEILLNFNFEPSVALTEINLTIFRGTGPRAREIDHWTTEDLLDGNEII